MTGDQNRKPALVDAAWLAAHKDDPDVCLIEIDRFSLDQYESGHIEGAIGWNWKQALWDKNIREFPDPDEFARRVGEAGIGNDTYVIIYGEPIQFGVYAWWVLRYCGHQNVALLDGGHRRWQAEGRPLVAEATAPPNPVTYNPVKRNEAMRASRDDVLAAIGNPQTNILDARAPEEFNGKMLGTPEGNHGAERYGRIPGARHRHFTDLLTDDERFKPKEELHRLFDETGVDPEKKTIAYCRLSHRATVAYFSLTELLGYQNVRVYDGSWTEWGSIVGVPIENP